MRKPVHLFMISQDRTYCGIPMMVIAEHTRKYSLTLDVKEYNCEECEKGLGLYLLSKA